MHSCIAWGGEVRTAGACQPMTPGLACRHEAQSNDALDPRTWGISQVPALETLPHCSTTGRMCRGLLLLLWTACVLWRLWHDLMAETEAAWLHTLGHGLMEPPGELMQCCSGLPTLTAPHTSGADLPRAALHPSLFARRQNDH